MRAGDRMSAIINGRSLQPQFALRGFDLSWAKAAAACALGEAWDYGTIQKQEVQLDRWCRVTLR
jgi:hypothetical protein